MASRNNKNSKFLPVLLICLVMGLLPYFTWFTTQYNSQNKLVDNHTTQIQLEKNSTTQPKSQTLSGSISPEISTYNDFKTGNPNPDLIRISPTDFVSGIFYGVMILSLISTLSLYLVYKHRKWAVFLTFQGILLAGFSYADIGQCIARNDIYYLLPYFQHLIVISGVMYSIYLLSYFYSFKIKRIAYNYQFKLYTLITLLGLCVLGYNSIYHSMFPLLLYLSVIVLVGVTQVALYRISLAKRKVMPISLLTILIILYTLIYTDLHPISSILDYQNTITIYKLIIILAISANLYLNYLLLIKHYINNKQNEIFVTQYISLIKNYHKLLIQEKSNQNDNTPFISQFKDNSQALEEYLKNNYKLTDREYDVLLLVWEGCSNKQISQELSITLSTAKYHIGNIYIKLNVNSRAQIFALKA
ncbi:response regulator transcription factor [Myroides sp. LJL119]